MEPDDLDLPTLTTLAAGGVVRELLGRVGAAGYPGVRPSHGYVFALLVEDEPTISSLASSLGITQQGASKQVRELEQLGYVERRPVTGDGRARGVRLTEDGRGAVEAGRSARADLEAEVVRRTSTADAEVARRVVATLLDIVGLRDDVRRRRVPLPVEGG